MKLSEETLELLKNYNEINSGIIISPGSELRTVSVSKSVLAIADCFEEFPEKICLYDLQGFLEVIKLFQDPEFDFSDDKCLILKERGKAQSVKYYYATEDSIVHTDKTPTLPDMDIDFSLSSGELAQILKAASVMRLNDIAVKSFDDEIALVVKDKDNPSTNNYTLSVGDNKIDADFEMYFKVQNLKMYPGSYNVGISSRHISKFEGDDPSIAQSLVYYVAMESDGKFEKN